MLSSANLHLPRLINFIIFAAVKFRIYIFVAILSAGLSFTLDRFLQTDTDAKSAVPTQHADTLKGNGQTSDRYVDYNYAFCAGSGTSITAQRTNGGSSIPRNPGTWKRCHESDSQTILLHSGKVCSVSAVNSFLSTIMLHPSGLMSDSHRFIQLCRLTV